MLNLNSLAASPCVISFFLVFFNATSRSLSTWVISSCPSCIPKAWGCQDDISTLLKDDILILLPQTTVWSRDAAPCFCSAGHALFPGTCGTFVSSARNIGRHDDDRSS